MGIACALVSSPEHDFSGHPENPQRFTYLAHLPEVQFPVDIEWLKTDAADPGQVSRIHDAALLTFLQEACKQAPALIDSAPTYVSPSSWQAALDAAGGALACTQAVLSGEAAGAFALVRPPGHHATAQQAMGFCLLNNLAIAVQSALDAGLEEVLIVDYDAHHGNGTQDIFLHERRVTFISIHQSGIYPGSGSLFDAPERRRHIINIPLPPQAGDRALTRIMDEIIHPLAQRLTPQIIFISAGFDAHWSDPLTDLGVSTTGFFQISRALVSLAQELCMGRIVFVLEGGYDARRLADNARSVLDALTGADQTTDPTGPCPYPEPDISTLINQLKEIHI